MLIFSITLLTTVLSSSLGTEHQTSPSGFAKLKRGIVEMGPSVPNYKFRPITSNTNIQPIQSEVSKTPSYYKDSKPLTVGGSAIPFDGVFKQSSPYINEQSSPYFDKMFTMSAGYKVANNGKSLKQTYDGKPPRNENFAFGSHGLTSSSNIQVPVYKTNYPISKNLGSQAFASPIQTSPYGNVINGKKASLPILEVQSNQEFPAYLPSFGNQQLVSKANSHQFNFPSKTQKLNNVQLGAPFLSPLSSFQGQVVPISAANNPRFPQYKGASIEVHPTVGGFSTTGYEPLQTQPQLHFGNGNGQPVRQPVGSTRYSPHVEQIRSDVEIINKKKPTTPPPKKDDDEDEEDDEGYSSIEKEYGPSSTDDDDDYRVKSKSEKYFKPPETEGDFKPSTSFPFKEYDEKFGRHSNQNHDEDTEEKPGSKYPNYSNDDDDDEGSSSKYRSEDSSSKRYYTRPEQGDEGEEEEEDEKVYERQKTGERYNNSYKPKYFEKDFDDEYETSYRKDSPKQRYTRVKETPEVEYGSRSPRKNKDNYETEDSSSQGSRTSFKYHKQTPKVFQDNDEDSFDVSSRMLAEAYEGTFGYKSPDKMKIYRQTKGTYT